MGIRAPKAREDLVSDVAEMVDRSRLNEASALYERTEDLALESFTPFWFDIRRTGVACVDQVCFRIEHGEVDDIVIYFEDGSVYEPRTSDQVKAWTKIFGGDEAIQAKALAYANAKCLATYEDDL